MTSQTKVYYGMGRDGIRYWSSSPVSQDDKRRLKRVENLARSFKKSGLSIRESWRQAVFSITGRKVTTSYYPAN